MTENCPNCGAVKHGSVCEYCGTRFGYPSVEVEREYVDVKSWDGTTVLRIRNGYRTSTTIKEGA